MVKKVSSRIYASVLPKNAKFNTVQKSAFLTQLAGLYLLIKSWVWVANPAGQSSQRTPAYPVTAVVKIKGRKNPLTVNMPIGFQVAYNPSNGNQQKGDMTRWLTALRIGTLDNFPRIAELYAEHLTFFGYKMLTSLDTSREGCLMASALNHLESDIAILVSCQWGENEVVNRDEIELAMNSRVDFSKRAIDGGFWTEKVQSKKSIRNLDGITI